MQHVDLDLDVRFDRKILEGTVTLSVERVDPAAALTLDTRGLDVSAVETASGETWSPAQYELGVADPILGAPLTVTLPPGATRVRVAYATRPGASGLQWLEPPQTAGKAHPFLFSQSQAIHARSWIPIQDTPQVRLTYTATIRTPPELVAVMSAAGNPTGERGGVYRFAMPQRIPAYLMAIAAGDIAFAPLGERAGVYAEPSVVGRAAAEFADTEKMMEAAERLYGPYRWDRYDILVLPPSFPFGGMENPRLTFATPTVLAGDKSLVSLIAHELAHSWSGNLVTNATWSDFWLNEGLHDVHRAAARRGGLRPGAGGHGGRTRAPGSRGRDRPSRGPGRDPPHRPLGARSGRRSDPAALRERLALPAVARRALRPPDVRRVPAGILRPLRVPEHPDGGLRRLPARSPLLAPIPRRARRSRWRSGSSGRVSRRRRRGPSPEPCGRSLASRGSGYRRAGCRLRAVRPVEHTGADPVPAPPAVSARALPHGRPRPGLRA